MLALCCKLFTNIEQGLIQYNHALITFYKETVGEKGDDKKAHCLLVSERDFVIKIGGIVRDFLFLHWF